MSRIVTSMVIKSLQLPSHDQILRMMMIVRFLHEQLGSAFSVQDSPVWMDSSTRFISSLNTMHIPSSW